MLFEDKKCISPIVGTSLLLVVAVITVVGFQSWFQTYSSSMFSDVEMKSSISDELGIKTLIGNTLYVKSGSDDNISINELNIGGIECSIDKNLSKGITELDVSNCLSRITVSTPEIVLITQNRIVEKSIYLDNLDESFWCYQETANSSHSSDGSCDLNYSGSYSFNGSFVDIPYLFDNNITTGVSSTENGYHYIYMNYSKPIKATSDSFFQATIHYSTSIPSYETENITIPIECWNQNILQFQKEIYVPEFGSPSGDLNCYNGTGWTQIAIGFIDTVLYEEAMWWDISK